jgi:hypothetical protein
MIARATLWNGRTVIENGGHMVVIWGMKYNFEVISEI